LNRKFKLTHIIVTSLVLASLSIFNLPYPASSAPGDETVVGSISLVPTIECIGVVSNFTSDSNHNNNAVLEYRQAGTSNWKTAPEMYADRTGHQYRGSIFWLTTNTSYEVRVTYVDPDGVTGSSVISTVTTRDDDPPIGTDYRYVSLSGSDSNDGSLASPWRTIQHAFNVATPGMTILLRGGTYYQAAAISRSGLPGQYITLMPYNSESVIIDGTGSGTLMLGIWANYIRIKGLTLINAEGSAIEMGTVGSIVEGCVITNPDPNYAAIVLWDETENVIIQGNTFNMNHNGTCKTCVYYWKNRGGHVFRNNLLTTSTNGIDDGFGGGPEDSMGYMNNCDFYNNVIIGAGDDGIQSEGSGVNCRIWGNTISDSWFGLATCPILQGPTYIFRNKVSNCIAGMLKVGDNSYGRIYIYHNTYCSPSQGDGIAQTNSGLGNIVSRNNIIYSQWYIFEMGGSDHDFDYDSLYTTNNTGRFIKWDGGQYGSFSSFQSGTGQELHGILEDTEFVNPASGNLNLQPTSTCIDAGVILVGFNDANSPWPYSGNAPDIGACEYAGGSPTNHPPVLNAIGNKSVNTGQTLQFTILATDADGDTLTYSASNLPSGATFTPSTRTFSWTPTSSQAGTYPNVRFTVSDGSLTDYENITITVSTSSTPLSIPLRVNAAGNEYVDSQSNIWVADQAYTSGSWGFYGADNTVDRGTGHSISGTVDDRIYQTERYGLSGYRFDLGNGTYDITLHFAETYRTGVGQRVFDVSIEGQVVLDNLDIYSEVGYSTALKKVFNNVTIQDGQLNIEFASSIEEPEINGIEILSAGSNSAPVLSTIGSKTVSKGTLLQFTVYATDPDGDALTYSASNLPSGATFTPSTRTFSWTPTSSQVGTYPNVRFTVSDGSLTDYENITITVLSDNNSAPVLNAIGNKSVTVGQTLQFTVSATDADDDTLIYSASNLPLGATFNSQTGIFSWTPTSSQAGSYPSVLFAVSDGSLTDYEYITITVVESYDDWDVNSDGVTNILDIILVGQHWGETGLAGWIRADVNKDGIINVLDMITIGQHWTG
jgi:hypothetical protein